MNKKLTTIVGMALLGVGIGQNWEYGIHSGLLWTSDATMLRIDDYDAINRVTNCGLTGEVDYDVLTPLFLNCLGAVGWEVVSVHLEPTLRDPTPSYLLKRPLP